MDRPKNKEVQVSFSPDADSMYKELQGKAAEQKKTGIENSLEIQLLKAIDREIENLKINPQKGLPIRRSYISKQVVQRYGTNKLWKIELVSFWRIIYTLTGDQVRIITFILEIMDHKKYDKVFGWRGK